MQFLIGLCYGIAFGCFVLAAAGVSFGRLGLVPFGLAFWLLGSKLLTMIPG